MGQCCAGCCGGDEKKKDDTKKDASSKKNNDAKDNNKPAGVNTTSTFAQKPVVPTNKSATKKQIPPQLKMERGPKVKIVVDEERILKAIKERESLRYEMAMIGKTKPQAKSAMSGVFKSTASVSPKGNLKTKSRMANSNKSAADHAHLFNRNETMSNDFNSRRNDSHAVTLTGKKVVSSVIGQDPYHSSATGMDSSLKSSNIGDSDVVSSSVMSGHSSSNTAAARK